MNTPSQREPDEERPPDLSDADEALLDQVWGLPSSVIDLNEFIDGVDLNEGE